MTLVKLHGILGREYGESFKVEIENPKHILAAIDCNREGFLARVIELQRNGFVYDIIVKKKRIEVGRQMDEMTHPETIDLVPAIVGSAEAFAIVLTWFAEGSFLAKLATAVIFAAISYALTPKPEIEALEIEAAATKGSLIFSNRVNVASQGVPVPLGYGRLKVGSQVVQATIKSFPQYHDPALTLTDGLEEENPIIATSRRQEPNGFDDPDDPWRPNGWFNSVGVFMGPN